MASTSSSSNMRIEVERFDGSGDFMLRKIRMLAHLGYLGLKEILKDDKLLMEPPAIEKKEDDDSSAAGSPKAKSQSQDPSGRAEWRGASKRNGRSRSNSKSRMVCWYCKKEGHMRKDCFSRKKKIDREDQGEAAVIMDKLHYSNALAFQEQTMFKDIDKPVIQAVDQPVEQASTKVELVLDKGKGKLVSDVAIKSDEIGSSTGGGAGGEKDKPEELARDRKRRVIIPHARYKTAPPPDHLTEDSEVAFALAVFEDIDVEEPKDYYEAIRSANKKQWKAFAVDEMNSLEKNETWDVVDRPKDRKVIGCRWIFKIKPGVPDDMLLAPKGMDEITKLKKLLSSEFDMKDLGSAKRILGMDIFRNREAGTLQLSQSEYLQKVLKKFNMVDCKSSNTPVGAHFKLSAIEDASEMLNPEEIPYSSAVGSVMYAMVGSRPDLVYRVGLVSRYMSRPGELHWEAVEFVEKLIQNQVFNNWFIKG
ncbi:hypothetical protein YC2023_079959 [Brassica napus]